MSQGPVRTEPSELLVPTAPGIPHGSGSLAASMSGATGEPSGQDMAAVNEYYLQQEASFLRRVQHQHHQLALEQQAILQQRLQMLHKEDEKRREQETQETDRLLNKKEDEQSAVASQAVKARLRECLLNKASQSSPPQTRNCFRAGVAHSSLEQHSPPVYSKHHLSSVNDDLNPLRKTSSEPNIKIRQTMKQRMIDRRNSPITPRRDRLTHRRGVNPLTVGGIALCSSNPDSGPNTPPSAHTVEHKQEMPGLMPYKDNHSLPNIPLARERAQLPDIDLRTHLAAVHAQHGFPFPPPPAFFGDSTDNMEAQMKALALAQSLGHLPDPTDQPNMGRTLSAPTALPPYLYFMWQQQMIDPKDSRSYLKQRLQSTLNQRISSSCHMEDVDEDTEASIAQELNAMKSKEKEAPKEPDAVTSTSRSHVKDALYQKVMRSRDQPRARAEPYPSLATASPPIPEDASMSTGLAYSPVMLEHRCVCGSDETHPENSRRLSSAYSRLRESGLLDSSQRIDSRLATIDELMSCHSEPYSLLYGCNPQSLVQSNIDPKMFEPLLTRFCELPCGGMGVDTDTVWNEQTTPKAVRMAAGCAVDLSLQVAKRQLRNGFALVRPPGHHAEPTIAMGFCYVNNIAIAAKQLLDQVKMRKILLLDWDVHHGNSTQQIFYADPRVLYLSLHRHDKGNFFPGTGDSDETGIDRGLGFNVNVAWSGDLQPAMGDAEYLAAFRTIVLPIIHEFSPEIILVSAGFDAAVGHPAPMGGYKVSPECFGHMTRQLMSVAGGRLVLVLEGGYEPGVLADCVEICVKALQGHKIPPVRSEELHRAPCTPAQETLFTTIRHQSQFWPCLEQLAGTVSWSQVEFEERIQGL